MRKIVLISTLILLGVFTKAKAQTACFTADDTTGCTPFTLRLNDCSGLTNTAAPLYMITGPESHTGFDSVYVLNTPGLYSITQVVGISGGSGSRDTLTKHSYIQVLPRSAPDFTVETCIGRKTRVKILSNIYDEYSIDFGDGTIITGTPGFLHEHTYSDEFLKTVTVTGKYLPENCGEANSKDVQPYNTLEKPNVSSLEVLNASPSAAVELTFSTKNTYKYKVLQKISGDSFIEVDSILFEAGTQKVLFSNLDTENKIITYKVATYDDCGNELSSDEISTISNNVINGDNEVNLEWITNINFDNFSIDKNNILLFTTTETSFQDIEIKCGNEYCYKVTGNINNIKSISATQCITGKSEITPPAVSNLESGFNGSQLILEWEIPESLVEKYSISEIRNGSPSEIATTIEPSYSINNPDLSSPICYKVNYKDKCNNVSPLSSSTCPVVLSIDRKKDNIMLSWTPYSGNETVTYEIETYDNEGNLISSYPTGSTTYFVETNDTPGTIIYKVKINGSNNYVAFSNEVEVTNDIVLLVPNAFSPNNDGTNDTFKVEGKFVNEFRLTIFNNWGEVIYSNTDINKGWDGTLRGTQLPTGSYAYIVEATDFDGKSYTKSGTLTLLK